MGASGLVGCTQLAGAGSCASDEPVIASGLLIIPNASNSRLNELLIDSFVHRQGLRLFAHACIDPRGAEAQNCAPGHNFKVRSAI